MDATNGAAPQPCRNGDGQGAGQLDEGLATSDPDPPEPGHSAYDGAVPTGRPVSLDTSIPKPAPEPTSQPATPSRKPGGHWPWDSAYMDYVQQRGDQVLLYSEYQSPGEPRSAAASERCSGSKYDPLDHSYDTRSLDDLALNGRGRAAKTLGSSIKQVADPQHALIPLNSLYHPSPLQITPSLTVASSPPPKPYEHPLDPQFRIVEKPKRFFSIGRIFKAVWFEPLGQQNPTVSSELDWSTACPPFYEEKPYAKFRWFVVVRKRLHHSLCLSITTFGGKTASKTSRGRAKDFVVLYPHTIEPPEPFPEEGIARQPIAVIIEEVEQLLAPTARLDCARIYTVEDTVKVMKIGRVHPESLEDLETYYQESVS